MQDDEQSDTVLLRWLLTCDLHGLVGIDLVVLKVQLQLTSFNLGTECSTCAGLSSFSSSFVCKGTSCSCICAGHVYIGSHTHTHPSISSPFKGMQSSWSTKDPSFHFPSQPWQLQPAQDFIGFQDICIYIYTHTI